MNKDIIHVAVAAIVNQADEVLISQRHANSHLGGMWEFPGGKVEPGETVEHALVRECREELAITPEQFRPLIKIIHHYPEKSVLLDVWKVEQYSGEISAVEDQPIRWQEIARLNSKQFPAADVGIIRALQLPELYMITGAFNDIDDFKQRLQSALLKGVRLVQLRLKRDWIESVAATMVWDVFICANRLCAQAGATLLLNVPEPVDKAEHNYGIHLDSARLMSTEQRPDCDLLSASCHNERELRKAVALNADFVVLSPVQATQSHPDTEPLGWQKFSELVAEVNVPVYALGGVDGGDVDTAWRAGAQGVAALSAFWQSE